MKQVCASILYLLWVCSLLSAAENVTSEVTTVKALLNVPPQYANEQQVQQEQQEQQEMSAEKLETSNVKPLQVTGFITAGGSIFEVDDKRSVGVIEARQNGQLLSPQPGEFICNYGSVVVYSDRPCEDVMQENTTKKSVKTETDKQTVQKQTASMASEQTQADDSNATEMGTKDEQMAEEVQQTTTTTKKPKTKKTKKTKKNKKRKNKNKKKKTNKRTQNGAQRIRVKTKIVKKRPTQQQLQTQPLRRPQSNQRYRPRPQYQQQQQQRRFQNRRFAQQTHGGLYTTNNGKIYELVEVAH